jgi:hypothetical protein
VDTLADSVAGREGVMLKSLFRCKECCRCGQSQAFRLFGRLGGLIRAKSGVDRAWEPARETHRGRLEVESAHDAMGAGWLSASVGWLKPSKTDPAGEPRWEVCFRVDADAGALSAGAVDAARG